MVKRWIVIVAVVAALVGGLSGRGGPERASAGSATIFAVIAQPSTSAGAAFNLSVVAEDQNGNTDSGYAGTVHFTSSDPQAMLPADTTLTGGLGTFPVTLKTAGNQTVTATDTGNSSITGSVSLMVNPLPANHLVITAPASATAGSPFNFSVVAEDQNGVTDTGYAGTVHFTSSDPQAVLPADAVLSSGAGSFSATLKTAGSQTVTATDTGNSSLMGTSGAITVAPSTTATHFILNAPPSASAGAPFSFTIVAEDSGGNVDTGYVGTVHFTSSDPQAALPADSTLTQGVNSFSATIRTAGAQTISGIAAGTPSITGISNVISVVLVVPPISQPIPTTGSVGAAIPTATPTPTLMPITALAATATTTTTIAPTSVVQLTATPTVTPAPMPIPALVIHNNPRTVLGGRSKACDLAGNTRGAREGGCEIVSSVSAAGAMVTYTLTYQDGSTQHFTDRADSRGHSLHPFNVAYRPPEKKGQKVVRMVARIAVRAVLSDGVTLGPVNLRFAVMR